MPTQTQRYKALAKYLVASNDRAHSLAVICGSALLSFAVQFNLGASASYHAFTFTALAAAFAYALMLAVLVGEATADGRSRACWYSLYGALLFCGVAGALDEELTRAPATAEGRWLLRSTLIALSALVIGGAIAAALELGKRGKVQTS